MVVGDLPELGAVQAAPGVHPQRGAAATIRWSVAIRIRIAATHLMKLAPGDRRKQTAEDT